MSSGKDVVQAAILIMLKCSLALLLLFVATPIVSAQGGTPQNSTTDCDSLCLLPPQERIVPRDPPSMCECMVLIEAGGSGGGSGEPMTPAEILDRMFADHERRVAHVDNYTVVQTSSITPMPVVLYYEKEMIEGRSTFQLVSPAELADREAAANGLATSKEIGAGVVSIADMLGGLAGGGASPPGANSPSAAATPASEDGIMTSEDMIRSIVDGIGDFGKGLQEGRGNFATQQGMADELFWNQDLRSRMRNTGKQEVLIGGTYYSCDVLYVDSRDLEGFDLGPGSEGYSINYARMWVSDTGFFEPIAMDIVLWPAPGGESFQFMRTHEDFRQDGPDGPIVPRRTTLSGEGLGALGAGGGGDSMAVVNEIVKMLVNNGPPTQEQMAQWISETIERGRQN